MIINGYMLRRRQPLLGPKIGASILSLTAPLEPLWDTLWDLCGRCALGNEHFFSRAILKVDPKILTQAKKRSSHTPKNFSGKFRKQKGKVTRVT